VEEVGGEGEGRVPHSRRQPDVRTRAPARLPCDGVDVRDRLTCVPVRGPRSIYNPDEGVFDPGAWPGAARGHALRPAGCAHVRLTLRVAAAADPVLTEFEKVSYSELLKFLFERGMTNGRADATRREQAHDASPRADDVDQPKKKGKKGKAAAKVSIEAEPLD
jgi:hypothetical protein